MDLSKARRSFQRLVVRTIRNENKCDSGSHNETENSTEAQGETLGDINLDNQDPNEKHGQIEPIVINEDDLNTEDSSSSTSLSAEIDRITLFSSDDEHSEHVQDDESNYGVSDENASSNNVMWQQQMDEDLNSKVAQISIKHRLTYSATNSFLQLLKDLGHEVSADARTILGTTRLNSDDSFEPFGLVRGLVKKIRKGVENGIHHLQLLINIDGIPLFRSSKTQFWPILGRIANCNDSKPFVISVYCGQSKPPNLKSFLTPYTSFREEKPYSRW